MLLQQGEHHFEYFLLFQLIRVSHVPVLTGWRTPMSTVKHETVIRMTNM
jgi:hypothetical protein